MVLVVRPQVEEFWKRIGLSYQPAHNGAPDRYTGNLTIHRHHLPVIIEEYQNGTTSTWIFQPPSKLKDHQCVNEKQGPWPGKGWYFVHYESGCPTTVREAVNALQLIVKDVLGKEVYYSQPVHNAPAQGSGFSIDAFLERCKKILCQR